MKPRYFALISIAAAVAAGTVLFVTAQKVQMADANLRHLQDETTHEKQTLHVLHAEWDYLNRPDRIEALAKTHLNMVPPQAGEIVPPKPKAVVAEVPHPQTTPAVQHNFQTMLDSLNKQTPATGAAR